MTMTKKYEITKDRETYAALHLFACSQQALYQGGFHDVLVFQPLIVNAGLSHGVFGVVDSKFCLKLVDGKVSEEITRLLALGDEGRGDVVAELIYIFFNYFSREKVDQYPFWGLLEAMTGLLERFGVTSGAYDIKREFGWILQGWDTEGNFNGIDHIVGVGKA